jgi:hypothetical protein
MFIVTVCFLLQDITMTRAVLVAVAAAAAQAQFLPPLKQKLLIPAYFAPCYDPNDPAHGAMSCDWDQICSDEAAHTYSAIGNVILNPASGPGTSCDPQWVNVSERVRNADANMGLIGYTYTQYGQRALSEVMADVDLYYSCYAPPLLTGIFVDESATDCNSASSYYAQLYSYIQNKSRSANGSNATVVLNAGTSVPECFAAVSDVVVTFEGPFSAYLAYEPDAWTQSYPAQHFAHIIYNASNANMTGQHLQAIRLSKQRNAGHVYITPLTLPNPYLSLPTPYIYWDQLLRWAVDII